MKPDSSSPAGRVVHFAAMVSVALAGLTYTTKNATSLVNGIGEFRRAASHAIFGPEHADQAVRSVSAGVKDGGKGSHWKSTTLCLRPQNGGIIVPGSARFIPERRSSDPNRAYWKVDETTDSVGSYCVTLSTGTGASEVETYISGYIQGIERVTVPYPKPI